MSLSCVEYRGGCGCLYGALLRVSPYRLLLFGAQSLLRILRVADFVAVIRSFGSGSMTVWLECWWSSPECFLMLHGVSAPAEMCCDGWIGGCCSNCLL